MLKYFPICLLGLFHLISYMAVGLQHKNLGWRGRGVSLKFMLKKQWGWGSWPKFKHDYTENVKNLGWRGRGSAWKIFEKNIGGVGV